MHITINVPGQEATMEFVGLFHFVLTSDDFKAFELQNMWPLKGFDNLTEQVIVQNMAVMLAITGQKFAIYEDETYMVGDRYLGNAEMRLEMEEYIYIKLEEN